MTRLRGIAGALAVSAGVVLAMGGFPALLHAGRLALASAPALVVALGLAALLRTLKPGRALLGPILLIATGGLALAVQAGLRVGPNWPRYIVAGCLMALGLAGTMGPRPARSRPSTAVQRTGAFILPVVYTPTEAPRAIVGRAVLGHLTIDLTELDRPAQPVDITLTVFGGGAELVVPAAWTVQPDRTAATYATRYRGRLNHFAETDPEPGAERDGESGKTAVGDVLLNLLSVGGTVVLRRE